MNAAVERVSFRNEKGRECSRLVASLTNQLVDRVSSTVHRPPLTRHDRLDSALLFNVAREARDLRQHDENLEFREDSVSLSALSAFKGSEYAGLEFLSLSGSAEDPLNESLGNLVYDGATISCVGQAKATTASQNPASGGCISDASLTRIDSLQINISYELTPRHEARKS